jgi:hypothetical protein
MTKPKSPAERIALQDEYARATAEAAAAIKAQIAKTEKLRALRLARDEAEKASATAAKEARLTATKTRRARISR